MMKTTIKQDQTTGRVTVLVEIAGNPFVATWRNAWVLIWAGLALGLFGRVKVNFHH